MSKIGIRFVRIHDDREDEPIANYLLDYPEYVRILGTLSAIKHERFDKDVEQIVIGNG